MQSMALVFHTQPSSYCFPVVKQKMKLVWSMVLLVAATAVINVAECFEDIPASDGGGVFHVGGKVLCQDCTEGWNEWVNGNKPIEGCTVSVTCMDDRKRIVYYESDKTDKAGEFEVIIKKYIYGKKINPKACFARLVSSPDPICNIPTDFAGGKTGVKLGRPSIMYRDIIKHILDPFYYTTPMCDEPDTNDDNNDNSYGKGKDNDNGNNDSSYEKEKDNDNDGDSYRKEKDNNNNNDNNDNSYGKEKKY